MKKGLLVIGASTLFGMSMVANAGMTTEVSFDVKKNYDPSGLNNSYLKFKEDPIGSGRFRVEVNLKPSGMTAYDEAVIKVKYNATPTGWTVNIGDSITNNGWAGDASTQKRDAEAQIYSKHFYAYESDTGGSKQTEYVPWAVDAGDELTFNVSDNYIRTENNGELVNEAISPYLFAFNNQYDGGRENSTFYVGINRVVSDSSARYSRYGTGVSHVSIQLLNGSDTTHGLDKTVFINPNHTETRDGNQDGVEDTAGTIHNPLASWDSLTGFTDGYRYLQFRGSTCNVTKKMYVRNYMKMGAYGNTRFGAKPVINSSYSPAVQSDYKSYSVYENLVCNASGNFFQLEAGTGVTLSNLDFKQGGGAAVVVTNKWGGSTTNLLINNCTVDGYNIGFTSKEDSTPSNLQISDCSIKNTSEDGMQLAGVTGLIVDNVTVENAGGDCMQFTNCSDGVLKSVTLSNTNYSGTGIRLRGGASDFTIDDAVIKGTNDGIAIYDSSYVSGNYDNLVIRNSSVSDIWQDGIFLKYTDGTVIDNVAVSKVNQIVTSGAEATGDCVQFTGCFNWTIKNSTLDHSDTGGKQTFYTQQAWGEEVPAGTGLVENCTVFPPKGNHGLSFYDNNKVTVRDTEIIGQGDANEYGIYSHNVGLEVHGTIFDGLYYGIGCASGDGTVFNSVFNDIVEANTRWNVIVVE